jgi:serine/threonine-protein kinase
MNPLSAKADFGVDPLWRPRPYLNNRFAAVEDGSVCDGATRLRWQQSGSPYSLSWKESWNYVARLNQERFAARDSWRIPTAPELMSLLTPIPHGGDFCIEPMFDRLQKTLWSCDRR